MKYDIEVLKRKMLVKYPFFGSVVTNVNYKENSEIPTAGTDGKTIYYNPSYLESLSVENQVFIFAHEVCHIAFNHILRSEGKDPRLWNIATDGVINQFLKSDGLEMAEGGVDIEDAINYDAEELYEKLLEEKQENSQSQDGNQSGSESGQSSQEQKDSSDGQNQSESQKQNEQNSNDGQGDSENQTEQSSGDDLASGKEEKQGSYNHDVGHDTHSMWESAVKKYKEEQSKSLEEKENKKENETSELEEKKQELEELGEKDAFKKNRTLKKKELEELKQALTREILGAGTTTNRDIRTVKDIGQAKPLIDWRYVLREAIRYDVDWSYKNATIEDGVVMANLEEIPKPQTEIVLDTSGSINEILLKSFLRECKNILHESSVKVGCFDTEFYGFHDIRSEEDIENMEFMGGGGTNFDAAVNAFSRRCENKIIFTDGDAPMPKVSIDAIWIVFGGIKINPMGGNVINITKEELERLYSYELEDKINGRLK